MFIDKAFGGPHLKADADYQQCNYRFITADGSKSSWHDVFPQSMGEKGQGRLPPIICGEA